MAVKMKRVSSNNVSSVQRIRLNKAFICGGFLIVSLLCLRQFLSTPSQHELFLTSRVESLSTEARGLQKKINLLQSAREAGTSQQQSKLEDIQDRFMKLEQRVKKTELKLATSNLAQQSKLAPRVKNPEGCKRCNFFFFNTCVGTGATFEFTIDAITNGSELWANVDLRPYDYLKCELDASHTSEGSAIYEGHSAQLLKVRQLYVALAKLPFVKTICEIGFNGGHSASLWLLANSRANVTMFDIWQHPYAAAGEKFLRNTDLVQNGNSRLRIVKGSSHETLIPYGKAHPRVCDIISVDGDHTHHGAVQDLKEVLPLLRGPESLVLLDDSNCNSDWCVDPARDQVIEEGYYKLLYGITEVDGAGNERGVSLLRAV
jgi:hypothetical protein